MLPGEVDELQRRLDRARSESNTASIRLGEPFLQESALKARQAELVSLNADLQTDEVSPPGFCVALDRLATSPGLGARSA